MPRLDIHSNDPRTYMLSNFHPHEFTIDTISYASMEAFLQCLKFPFETHEDEWTLCTQLSGYRAKAFGRNAPDWRKKQTLHYDGQEIHRLSEDYQALLDRAYTHLFCENREFHRALYETRGYDLEHTIGKRIKSQTVLTEDEFVSRLLSLRDRGGI